MCFDDGDNDHNHNSKDSPSKLKQEFNRVNQHVVSLKKKVKVSQQKSRRLKTKVTSLKTIVKQLRKKQLISSSCEEMLKRNFSGVPLVMLKRIKSKSGKGCKYPPVWKAMTALCHFFFLCAVIMSLYVVVSSLYAVLTSLYQRPRKLFWSEGRG